LHWETIVLAVVVTLLIYTWLGYPAILWILRCVLARPPLRQLGEPDFSIIVAAYNEEAGLASKLEDCLALEYPADRFEILVASDGSTDRTEEIVGEFSRQDSRIRLVRTAGRAGKSGAQNLAVEQARGEILLFTDAETRTRFNLLRQMAEDFADPRVGLVAPTVSFGRFDGAVSTGQGAYWRFELFLRQLESDLGILATASGSAFAMRRALFRPIPPQYGDDCILPLEVRLQGYAALQDPRAIVFDQMPSTVDGELRARARMTARNWTGILSRPALLNFLRYPGTAWALVSHKLFRWITPFFLAVVFLCSTARILEGHGPVLWGLQLVFYLSAFAGWDLTRRRRRAGVFGYSFSFCLANLGFFLGLVKALRQQKIVTY
jgi:cellulose synthase/poly-beta-1,6-N-acetylglucosamine synthase-like glycosyltransferase